MPGDARRGAVGVIVVGGCKNQTFANTEVPIRSEDLMRRIRQFPAEPGSRNPSNVKVRTQTSQGIQFIRALKVRTLETRW
jgi:hypothetical protein